jgi:hypothetical protein
LIEPDVPETRRHFDQAESLMKCILTFAVLLSLAPAAVAQTHQPYAEMRARAVKALSEQQVADLKSGRGMGLALAAELNGYPGPVHLLELADRLDLSETQRSQIQGLFAAMKAEAVPLGERLIQQESDLDRQFAGRTVTPSSLAEAVAALGVTRAALQEAHLKYHLSTVGLLTPEQVRRYSELRGYSNPAEPHPGRSHHHKP